MLEIPKLPIHKEESAIISLLSQKNTLILTGSAGSGKSTQVPQFLLKHGYSGILITQPRRVACVSLAQRVSEETNSLLGDKIGYSIRFDNCTSRNTQVKYATDGMLLREALSDPLLSKYSVIILDEAHERTVNTDILFALVKGIQKQRPELRIIAMSATLKADMFSQYFSGAPVLAVEGRMYPVNVAYVEEKIEDYNDAVLACVQQICVHGEEGDVLVFLPGQEDIEALDELLRTHMARTLKEFPELRSTIDEIVVLPLYSALPKEEQMICFPASEAGKRKVVLSTNIAETSVTINGIKYVVDCGLSKKRYFHSKTGVEYLVTGPISQAESWQRAGRAGRERAGVCYRLYTENQYEEFEESPTPEIKRYVARL